MFWPFQLNVISRHSWDNNLETIHSLKITYWHIFPFLILYIGRQILKDTLFTPPFETFTSNVSLSAGYTYFLQNYCINLFLADTNCSIIHPVEIVERKGVKYIHPLSTTTRIEVGKVANYNFEGLFRDNKELGTYII